MSLTHFNPLAGISLFEDAVNRMFSEPATGRPWSPDVDVFETEKELVLKADLPDMKLEDIEVLMENQVLTLKGERRFAKEEKNKGYHRIERGYGSFTRSFSIPPTVDSDKIAAEYDNGVLTVSFPKKEVAEPRQVKIAVKG